MVSPVPVWNATRRDVLDRFQGVVEAQVRVDGVKKMVRTEAVSTILHQLAEMSAEIFSYLARNFDDETRRLCCLFHHSWMLENLCADRVHEMLIKKPPIWSENMGEHRYVAALHMERFVSREGELSLELFFDRKMICVGSFSFLPARLFGLEGAEVLLVSRIQGGKERIDDIRLATKTMSDVAPRAVIFALLTGIARAVGVNHVIAVSAENHADFVPLHSEALHQQYDDFYLALGAVGPQNGFYIYDVAAAKKPLNAQKVGHRVRTRRKRQLKEKISDAAKDSFSSWLCRNPEPPAPGGG